MGNFVNIQNIQFDQDSSPIEDKIRLPRELQKLQDQITDLEIEKDNLQIDLDELSFRAQILTKEEKSEKKMKEKRLQKLESMLEKNQTLLDELKKESLEEEEYESCEVRPEDGAEFDTKY